jgi:hypothetical protein
MKRIKIGSICTYNGPDWGMRGYTVKVIGVFVHDGDGEGHVDNDPRTAPRITKASCVEVQPFDGDRLIPIGHEVDALDLVVQ